MSAKTSVCQHHAGLLTQVTDRCKHLYSTKLLFLSNSFVCTCVFGNKKGHFFFLSMYIHMYLYVLFIAYVCVHNLYYRLVHTCILSQRTVTYFKNIITFLIEQQIIQTNSIRYLVRNKYMYENAYERNNW